MSRAILFTGLPSNERQRQRTALETVVDVRTIEVVFCDRDKYVTPPKLQATDLVVFDTTWSCHKTFNRIKAAVKLAGAQMIAARLTPGTLAAKLRPLLTDISS